MCITVITVSAQDSEWDAYLQRIHTIENLLGVKHHPLHSLDDIMQRLDELETLSASAIDADYSASQETTHASINSLELGGWVMLSYFYDDKRDLSTFAANVIELDLRYALSQELSFAAELDYINEDLDPVLPAFRNRSYSRGGTGSGSLYSNTSSGNDDDDDFVLEQLYARYERDDWAVQGGKFNSPYGLEPLDPWDWYGVLPSIVFPLYPHNITGVMSEFNIGEQLTISPYISNGLDADLNTNDSFVYSIFNQYRLADDIQLAANISYGAFFPGNNSDDGWLFNLDATYIGISKTLFGLQTLWFTSETDHVAGFANVDDIEYYGVLGIVAYDWNQYVRIAAQSGFVDDNDGFIWGSPQERWEFSFIPSFYLAEWIEVRLQYQHIEANGDFISIRHTNPPQDKRSGSDDLFGAALYVKF